MSIYNVFLGLGGLRSSIDLTIASDTQNYNLLTAASNTGRYRAGKSDIRLNINSGVYVGSTSTSAALNISGFTIGDTIRVTNNGVIIGKGGNGGNAGSGGGGGSNGQGGGLAILLTYPTTIYNYGTIAGGGGGGGAGQGGTTYGSCGYGGGSFSGSGGGGGAGYTPGSGGSGSNGGSSGTRTSGGAAGTGEGGAGAGGGPGAAGQNGQTAAGAGGAYIQGGQQYATWAAIGTRLGSAT